MLLGETKDSHYYECLQIAARKMPCCTSWPGDGPNEYELFEYPGLDMIERMVFDNYPQIVWC